MTALPGYDEWLARDPDEERCEFCGAHIREAAGGWHPNACTGACGLRWRDPDAEYEAKRDDRDYERDFIDDLREFEAET